MSTNMTPEEIIREGMDFLKDYPDRMVGTKWEDYYFYKLQCALETMRNLASTAEQLLKERDEARKIRDEWCAEYTKARNERDALKKRLSGAVRATLRRCDEYDQIVIWDLSEDDLQILGKYSLLKEYPDIKEYRAAQKNKLFLPTDVLILPAEENNSHQTKESVFAPEQTREINQTHNII